MDTQTAASAQYLGAEAEAAFGLHHLLQDVALDAGSADVFIDHAVLQVHVVHSQADQRQVSREREPGQPVVCTGQCSLVSTHSVVSTFSNSS